MAIPEPITVAVINYNGGDTLIETLDSLSRQAYPDFSLLVVDNGSTDGSLARVSEKHPSIRIVSLPENRGPSAARNAALRESKTNLVFLSDNDITANPDLLSMLVEEMRRHADAVICAPRILYADGTTIVSDGVRLHYMALSMPRHRRMAVADVTDTAPKVNPCSSGGMMLVDKSKVGTDGLFDEDYFFGWDDVEFSYRRSLAGHTAITVPAAAVCHKHKVWGMKRSFYQLRNRWYFLLINYSGRTLLLISPVLAVYEVALACLMLAKGHPWTYCKAMLDVFRHLGPIRLKRRQVQSSRVRKDANLLSAGDIYIEHGILDKAWMKPFALSANRLFDLYWRLVRPLLLIVPVAVVDL